MLVQSRSAEIQGIIWLALEAVPIWYGFGRTDMIACFAGLIIMVRREAASFMVLCSYSSR
jgi:hypothetical protein